jgi:hypothetical protein
LILRSGARRSSLAVASFHFLSREEKHGRVLAANMNGHFIDGSARSSDIPPSRYRPAEGYPHENGSNTGDRKCAQAQGAALFLSGDRRLLLIHL